MSSQMTVIIAGIVLVVAIVVALVIMRRGDSRFTYDTQHGTAPRATEGEGNTAATAFKGRFSILTTGVGAMFAALPSSCGACRWSRRTITKSRLIAIRRAPLPHPLCAVASSTAMAWRLSRTVPHLLSWPIATLLRMRFWFVILPTCSVCPTWRFCAIFRTIPRAPRACIPSRRTSVAPRLPIFRSTPASSRASRLPSVPSASIHMARRMPYLGIYRHHYLRAARGPE